MFDHDGTLFFGGGFMWILWVLLIVLLVMGLFKGIDHYSDSDKPSQGDSPMEILKKRYAQGEIDEDEFERRRKVLDLHTE